MHKWGSRGTREGEFDAPNSIAVSTDERLYVSDTGNNRIQVFDSSDQHRRSWGSDGAERSQFKQPLGICLSLDQSRLYVCDHGNSRIQVFMCVDGRFVSEIALLPRVTSYVQANRNGRFPQHLKVPTSCRPNTLMIDKRNRVVLTSKDNEPVADICIDPSFHVTMLGEDNKIIHYLRFSNLPANSASAFGHCICPILWTERDQLLCCSPVRHQIGSFQMQQFDTNPYSTCEHLIQWYGMVDKAKRKENLIFLSLWLCHRMG